jgi:tetratricopeptide (TPR) repeat protein
MQGDPAIVQAEAEKQKANAAFKQKDFEGAVGGYSRAFELREHYTYCGNRALCYIKLERWEDAAADALKSIELNPKHDKGYARLAKAKMMLGEDELALEVVHDGLKVSPSNIDLRRLDGELIAKRQRLDKDAPRAGASPPEAPVLAHMSQNTLSKFNFTNAYFLSHAAHMPLRLTDDERAILRLLEGAMTVSDYTNKVDIVPSGGSYHYGFGNQKYGYSHGGGYGGVSGKKLQRVVAQAEDVLSMLSGLLITHDMRRGAKLVVGADKSMKTITKPSSRGPSRWGDGIRS